jgi:hypothetical protein
LYREINEFKRGCQPRNNLVPVRRRIEVKIAIAKLKKYKSPGSDQIPTELIQAGGEILMSAIHKLINSVLNKEELPDKWKESINVPVQKKDETVINCIQTFIKYPLLKVKSVHR